MTEQIHVFDANFSPMDEERRLGRLELNGVTREDAIAEIEKHQSEHGDLVEQLGKFHRAGAGKDLYDLGESFAKKGVGTASVHLANGEVHIIDIDTHIE